MRIWPSNTHHGMIFFNYVPIQEKAWEIAPGKLGVNRYQIRVSDEPKTKVEAIEAAWTAFSKTD